MIGPNSPDSLHARRLRRYDVELDFDHDTHTHTESTEERAVRLHIARAAFQDQTPIDAVTDDNARNNQPPTLTF